MGAEDWAKFDAFPEDTCFCLCGRIFRSHARVVMASRIRLVSRKPCPGCGQTDAVRKASSDPVTFTIGGNGEGESG